MNDERNPHVGAPFTDDDDAIAAALEDVSRSRAAVLAGAHDGRSVVDPRGVAPAHAEHPGPAGRPDDEELADLRRRAVPAIAAYRDGGCVPHELPRDVVVEMMAFLAGTPLEGVMVPMFLEDMQFDGADSGAISWGDEVPDEAKAASPVVVIGCGLSGILAGIRLTQAGLPFVIVEKDEGPGGTWWENRYPGARVDVGSHHYCYAFEPSHHWTEYFCQQPELRDYFVRVLDKYELRPHCRFGTEVTSLTWDEPTSSWQVGIRNPDGTTEVLEARFVISAVGSLNIPRLPDIPGMDDFAGPSFHSARWPDGLDLTGTRFALVGAGASGFQIAPTIADRSSSSRSSSARRSGCCRTRCTTPRCRPVTGGRCSTCRSTRAGSASSCSTRASRWARSDTGSTRSSDADEGIAINEENELRRQQLTAWITMHLEDRPDLIEKSIPDYPAMGKRILQDNGSWLRTLKKPNVELVHTAIERIVPEGVRTVDGQIRDADVICYATGFRHNDFLAPIEFTGRSGVSLREQWGDEPTAYLGITIPNFPNLFCMYGPGTNLAHGASLFFHSECQIHYAMDCIHRVLAGGARTIEVRKDAHDEYVERYRAEIDQLVWSHPSIEHSHYKNPQGKIFTLSPWPIELYWEWTRSADPDQYVVG